MTFIPSDFVAILFVYSLNKPLPFEFQTNENLPKDSASFFRWNFWNFLVFIPEFNNFFWFAKISYQYLRRNHSLKLRIFLNYSRPRFENLIRKSNDVRFVVEITLYFWQWQVSSLEHFGTEPVFVPKSESLEHYLFVSHILNFLLRSFWKYFLSKLPIFQNFVRLNLETSQTQHSNRRPDNQSKMRFSFSDFQDFFWSHFLRRKKWFSEYWYWLTSAASLLYMNLGS